MRVTADLASYLIPRSQLMLNQTPRKRHLEDGALILYRFLDRSLHENYSAHKLFELPRLEECAAGQGCKEQWPCCNPWILSRAHAFILVSHVSGSEFVSCIAARMKPVTLPTQVSPVCVFLSFHLNGAKAVEAHATYISVIS